MRFVVFLKWRKSFNLKPTERATFSSGRTTLNKMFLNWFHFQTGSTMWLFFWNSFPKWNRVSFFQTLRPTPLWWQQAFISVLFISQPSRWRDAAHPVWSQSSFSTSELRAPLFLPHPTPLPLPPPPSLGISQTGSGEGYHRRQSGVTVSHAWVTVSLLVYYIYTSLVIYF